MRRTDLRRGTAYLLVLVTVLITVAVGVSSVMVHRVRRERLDRIADMDRARAVAQAGLELAVAYIQSDGQWRTNRGLGTWMDGESVLDGTVTLVASDPDGDANDDAADQVTLVSEAVVGSARQAVSATFTPVPVPMTCLQYSSSSGDQTGFNGTLGSNGTLASNGSMGALLATVNANVIAGGSITGISFNGTTSSNAGTRQHPASSALDWYIANGTPIAYSSLPSGRISSTVIGPNRNPYGSTNAMGIYVIDCGNSNISIRNCRIEGTLVLLNAGNSSTIDQRVNWKPAMEGMPALLVQGRMRIELSSSNLSEATSTTNFNPSTAPYNGVSDNDMLDTYPSRIEGLLYATDDFVIQGSTTILGQVVATDDITYNGTVTITRSSTYTESPPQGFIARYNLLSDPASFARVIDE